jgi:hypothetical protein
MTDPLQTTKRAKLDWEAIENDWRIGKLTEHQMAEKHHCSREGMRKRFNRLGIKRDLSKAVREATKAALIEVAKEKAEEVGKQVGIEVGKELAEAQISGISSAASENVTLILSHRRDISSLKSLSLMMAGELANVTGKPIEIEQLVLAVGQDDPAAAQAIAKVTSLSSRVQTAEKLAATLGRLITLERQAHNLDDDGSSAGGSLEDILLRISKAEQ